MFGTESKLLILTLFSPPPPQELDQLQAIWELTLDWESHWDEWKANSFSDLETEAMEEHVNNLYRKLNKFSRELKVSHVMLKVDYPWSKCVFVVLDVYIID